jgi:hypothetical protein
MKDESDRDASSFLEGSTRKARATGNSSLRLFTSRCAAWIIARDPRYVSRMSRINCPLSLSL